MISKGDIKRLWIFDFDGTVSNLVPDRRKARLNIDCARMIDKLIGDPENRVAILSSRTLPDLCQRVGGELPDVYLGGNNGLIWQLPDGRTREKGGKEELLKIRRNLFMPKTEILKKYPGLEIEDKKWSIAIHLRRASDSVKSDVRMILEEISPFRDFRKLLGPEVIEILFFPEFDKAFGIRNLCEFLEYEPEPEGLICAGDDENDLSAMQWVLFMKGLVFTVGDHPLIRGSYLSPTPSSLPEVIFSSFSEESA